MTGFQLFADILSLLADHSEQIAFFASVVVMGLGAAALFLVCFEWSWLAPHYREFWPKFFLAFLRVFAAVAAIVAKNAAPIPGKMFWQQPWAGTLAFAAIGYLLCEISGAIGDHRFKLDKEEKNCKIEEEIENLKEDRDDAEFEALRLNWLITHLRRPVNEKRQRISHMIAQAGAAGRASVQQARRGLAPEDQVHILLEMIAAFFSLEAVNRDPKRHNQNFRVGLFAEKHGRLELIDAFDLVTRSHRPFSSYQNLADRYRLDNVINPSHAVRCVREGQTLIVPDCETEPDFEYFNERQRSYLKSMVAFPLNGLCVNGTNPVAAALLIDTTEPGFFSKEDRDTIELVLGEFALRIGLEYAVRGLIEPTATQERSG